MAAPMEHHDVAPAAESDAARRQAFVTSFGARALAEGFDLDALLAGAAAPPAAGRAVGAAGGRRRPAPPPAPPRPRAPAGGRPLGALLADAAPHAAAGLRVERAKVLQHRP